MSETAKLVLALTGLCLGVMVLVILGFFKAGMSLAPVLDHLG